MHEQGLMGHFLGPVRYIWCSYDGFVHVEVLDELRHGEIGLGLILGVPRHVFPASHPIIAFGG
jgi:hypothetical protein